MIDHVSIEVSDMARSAHFYERLLKSLGMRRLKENSNAVGFGKKYSEFWINLRQEMPETNTASGMHVCLRAPDKAAVDEFYQIAIENNGTDDGPPGLRPRYTPNYYAAFIRDPDGNRIEAVTFIK